MIKITRRPPEICQKIKDSPCNVIPLFASKLKVISLEIMKKIPFISSFTTKILMNLNINSYKSIPALKGTNTIAQGEALCRKSVLQPKPCRGEIFEQFGIFVKWMPPFQGSGFKIYLLSQGWHPVLCYYALSGLKWKNIPFISSFSTKNSMRWNTNFNQSNPALKGTNTIAQGEALC